MDETYQWPSSDWPNFVEGTTTGNSTYVYEEGETNSHSWSDPAAPLSVAQSGSEGDFRVVGFEHCAVSDSAEDTRTWDEGDSSRQAQDNVVYSRTAETVMKLFTGGKKQSGRRNLFMLSCTARRSTGITLKPNLLDDLDYWEWELLPEWGSMADVPPSQISIDGMSLGNDGKRYCSYADGLTRDVTPRIKNADFYTFDLPQPSKHKLLIKANSVLLASDRVRPLAKFVVGEKVDLEPVFSPDLEAIHETDVVWALPGDFVNAFNAWDAFGNQLSESFYDDAWALTGFRVDASWLHSERTRAWWFSGGYPFGLNVLRVAEHLEFSNGQQVSIAAKGLLHMHRPTISWDALTYREGVVTGRVAQVELVNEDGSTGIVAVLQVKLGEFDTGDGGLVAAVNSSSLFPGRIGCTQLIVRDSIWESFSDWRLDNTFPYGADPYGGPQASGVYLGGHTFGDSPGPCPFGGYMWDQFRQFFQFRSDKPGSIWATLGTAAWEWRGEIASSTNSQGWQWVSEPYCHYSQALSPSAKQHPEWTARKVNLP